MNGIFDSHAHYDDERFDADRDELLESIHREGVEYIMTIGADLPTSYAARELAERYDFVYFAAGIHPEQAGDAPENYLEELKALAAHPKCRAIGEIGLDYYWAENPPKERQMELFRQQVLLANRTPAKAEALADPRQGGPCRYAGAAAGAAPSWGTALLFRQRGDGQGGGGAGDVPGLHRSHYL